MSGETPTAWRVTPISLGCEFGSHYCKTHDLLISSCIQEAHEQTIEKLVAMNASLKSENEALRARVEELTKALNTIAGQEGCYSELPHECNCAAHIAKNALHPPYKAKGGG